MRTKLEPLGLAPVCRAIGNVGIAAFLGKEMMLLRFIVLFGVVVAIGLYAPMRATAREAAPSAIETALVEQKKEADPPRPRPTPGPRDNVFAADSNEQKKADPPRPRPKPGPKDGGEDE